MFYTWSKRTTEQGRCCYRQHATGEQADMTALAHPLLRNPDWFNKAREGREEEIDRCSFCNYCLERVRYDEPAFCRYLNE